MELVPALFGKEALEIFFRLLDAFAGAQPPALGAAVDVGVDGEGGLMKGLCHHHGGGFVADAGELFEGGEGFGHLTLVALKQDFRQIPNRVRLGGGKAAGANEEFDLFGIELNHFFRSVWQERGNLIDPDVGALGGEEDCDEECVGVAVVQGDLWLRKELI